MEGESAKENELA